MEGMDWIEVERRARQMRAQEIRRLLAAAIAMAKRAGAKLWSGLVRGERREHCGCG